VLATVAAALLVGAAVLVATFASGTHVAIEPEKGALNSGAPVISDPRVSVGKTAHFGATPSPTPSASPTSARASSCAGTVNALGGADPWGGCWPGPNNTGVPAGTALRKVPQDISSGIGWSWKSDGYVQVTRCNAMLNSLEVNGDVVITVGNGTHSAATPCVTIKNSKINGVAQDDGDGQYGPLVMSNVEVSAPYSTDQSTVLSSNYFLYHVNIHGGARGAIQCSGYCEVHDSWVHDFYLGGNAHYDGIGSNGTGGETMLIDHNSISCSFYNSNPSAVSAGAGCSADLGLFGDFDAVSNVTVNKNLFVSADVDLLPYCFDTNANQPGKAYPTADHLVVKSNVFERGSSGKCGQYGPVDEWQGGNGNVWSDNRWDNGRVLSP
jgi:hypothetical protein